MICDIDTKTAAEVDICYMSGSEISNNGTYIVTDENGDPVNLSGVVLEMQVKYKPEDPLSRVIIRLRTSDGTLTVGGVESNEITMHGNYQVDAGDRFYDVYRFDLEEYIQEGIFRITWNVTRN